MPGGLCQKPIHGHRYGIRPECFFLCFLPRKRPLQETVEPGPARVVQRQQGIQSVWPTGAMTAVPEWLRGQVHVKFPLVSKGLSYFVHALIPRKVKVVNPRVRRPGSAAILAVHRAALLGAIFRRWSSAPGTALTAVLPLETNAVRRALGV